MRETSPLGIVVRLRLGNQRGIATARRVGTEWVGDTDKYYDLTLQIYRLTKADLDYPDPGRINSPLPSTASAPIQPLSP